MPKPPAPAETQDQRYFRLFNEIGIIDQLATARFESALPHGLTVAQFSVLNHFARLGGERSPAALADAFQVARATMTSTLQKLKRKGFIDIKPDPDDGRGKRVSLTPAGRAARGDALKAAGPRFQDIAAALSETEIKRLLPVLTKLRAWLDDNR